MTIPVLSLKINGTLFPPEDQSWSRMPPGTEFAEKMWEKYENPPSIVLTREQVLQLGKDPKTVARYVEGGYKVLNFSTS